MLAGENLMLSKYNMLSSKMESEKNINQMSKSQESFVFSDKNDYKSNVKVTICRLTLYGRAGQPRRKCSPWRE